MNRMFSDFVKGPGAHRECFMGEQGAAQYGNVVYFKVKACKHVSINLK